MTMSALREKRKEAGLTLKELGDLVNVSKQYMSDLELRKDVASQWLARAIAKELHVDVTELFSEEQDDVRRQVRYRVKEIIGDGE